ncbi:hypothetical protein AB5N19_02527 [Seiridium cardinale]
MGFINNLLYSQLLYKPPIPRGISQAKWYSSEVQIAAWVSRQPSPGYATTNLIQLFVAKELATRIDASQKPKVIVNYGTAGACHTDLRREIKGFNRMAMGLLMYIIGKTAEVGSRTILDAILSGEESHRQYLADFKITRSSSFLENKTGAQLQGKRWNEKRKTLTHVGQDREV